MQNESLIDGGGGDVANEVAEKLGAYVDGELSPVEREAIESLLERDRSCREIVQSFRFLDEAARRESLPSVGAGEWARIWEAIQRRKDVPLGSTEPEAVATAPRDGKIVRVRWLYRVAAVAAVIALVAVGVRMIQPSGSEVDIVRPEPSPPAAASPEEEDVDIGEPAEDREDSIAVIDGYAPEIREDFVRYRDF